MKAVMISIRPEWCAKISSGTKTIEVRKTKPKLELPFKCYIYCTLAGSVEFFEENLRGDIARWNREKWADKKGRVMGEFVCDAICWVVSHPDAFAGHPCFHRVAIENACLTMAQAQDYSGGKNVYGWRISDLVIYDKPKELSEFYVWKKCNSCRKSGYESTACGYDEDCKFPAIITRPPQSWCYVEELT